MRAFVTGGTGVIGKRVVQRLIERDYKVTCLVRQPEHAAELHEFGAEVVRGDVADRESMRASMTGADVIFHIPQWFEIGLVPSGEDQMDQVNIDGTENVLELAWELGVPKIVYSSTVGVFGDTHGIVVDEDYRRDSPFDSDYDRTSYAAHKVAERLTAQGAPIIIVLPAAVYGPGDLGVVGSLLRSQLQRLLLVMPGADTGLSFVHVDDVAEGHILASENGELGQSYLLGGDAITLGDAFQVTARLAGVPAPILLLDSQLVSPFKHLVRWLERFVVLPPLLSPETLHAMGSTWWVTSAKAEQELGYTHRSIEEGMAETVLWEAAQFRQRPFAINISAALALIVSTLLIAVALLVRRRKRP